MLNESLPAFFKNYPCYRLRYDKVMVCVYFKRFDTPVDHTKFDNTYEPRHEKSVFGILTR